MPPPAPSNITRVQQFIVGGLAAGCFLFGAIVLGMTLTGQVEAKELSSGPFWLALVLIAGVAAVFPVMTQRGFEERLASLIRAGQAEAAGQALLARVILRSALIEGFGVLGGAFGFVTGSMPFALAPFLATVWLLLDFPTERKTQELLRR